MGFGDFLKRTVHKAVDVVKQGVHKHVAGAAGWVRDNVHKLEHVAEAVAELPLIGSLLESTGAKAAIQGAYGVVKSAVQDVAASENFDQALSSLRKVATSFG